MRGCLHYPSRCWSFGSTQRQDHPARTRTTKRKGQTWDLRKRFRGNLQHPSWWDVRIPNKDHRVDVFFTVFVDPNLQVFSLSLSSPKHMLEEPGRDSGPMSSACLVANLKENSEKQTTAVHLRIPVLWWIMSLILRIVSNILKDLAYDGSSFQDKPYKVCKSSSIFNPMAFTRTQPLLIIQLPLLGLSSMAAVQAWRSRVPQSTN